MTRILKAVAVALLLFAAGCGDSGGDVAETGTTLPSEDTTTSGGTETTSAPGAEATELDLTAIDYSYQSEGAISVPAGALTVHLENTGTEEHQATIVRLNDGVDIAQFAAAGASDPTGTAALALVEGYGGPNSVAPGEAGSAATIVDEGSYLFVCFIPSPSDGVPHVAKGMVLPFEVTAGGAGELAEADGTIRLKDFTFELPDDFSGQGTFSVDNAGPQPHEAAVYALADGKTVEDASAFLSGEAPPGPPPFTSAGGIGPVSVGKAATVDLDLDAGSYIFVCFIPDATTGAPHFVQGMIQQVDIE